MNDLVERAIEAFDDERMSLSGLFDDRQRIQCFTAAAKVLLDAALGEPTEAEREQMGRDFYAVAKGTGSGWDAYYSAQSKMFDRRKARLLAPKTPERRVTTQNNSGFGWVVLLDGGRIDQLFNTKENAETFRRGLIAEMKEKG